MARRPRPPGVVLSRKDLVDLQRRLSMMSQTAVQDFYQSAYFVCGTRARAFPQREGNPGVGAGVETNAEVALTPSPASFFPAGAAGSKRAGNRCNR